MTISAWLMILALAVGVGISQSIQSNSTTSTNSTRPPGKPAGNCWINGVWYNPCPTNDSTPPPDPEPSPDVQSP